MTSLNVRRGTVQLERIEKTGRDGSPEVRWRLPVDVQKRWIDIINTAVFIKQKLDPHTTMLVEMIDPANPRNHGFEAEYVSADAARTAVMRSQTAITVALSFVSFMICIQPDWETCLLGRVPPSIICALRGTWVVDPNLRRAGAFIHVDSVPVWVWNILPRLLKWKGLPLFLCWGKTIVPKGPHHPSE
ncbi:hypothetical protein PHLGIDRAFT_121170 [Phlebiopsis gigantea 11061_1 CR5-6]|uniref:Uncharacterized protein n=1 Tax=Phlebiopsis gigantea (strain 11061_1 CR5-6) TaxID=745531 RepID=A0A0C3NGP5_PHLG1|nr:hypothetical protein PHLGIDRAFT_121170 [Phlebiopsis gigantea 11061_1 CR5-6]